MPLETLPRIPRKGASASSLRCYSRVMIEWRPDGDVRAVAAIVHDYKLPSACWQRFGMALSARGIAVYALEFRGARRIDDLGDDAATLISTSRDREPSRPIFLLGHGQGAVAACLHVLANPSPLNGLVCASIPLELRLHDFVLRCIRWMAPLAPGSAALVRANDLLRASAPRLSLPLLVLHGSADSVSRPSGSEYLHKHAGSCDKTLVIFEGYHHDLFNDSARDLVVEKICQWIDARLFATDHGARIGIEYINKE